MDASAHGGVNGYRMAAPSVYSGITVDPEFHDLIPPLSDIERIQLEDNLTREGCRDPLVVWYQDDDNCILIDGHNRFEICERNEIEFALVEMKFGERREVIDWICRNQLGRRNLSPADASELRGRMYNGRKKAAHRPEKRGQNDPVIAERTADAVAKETGVSARTVKRDGKYAEAVDQVAETVPDIRGKVRSGEVTKSDVVEAAKSPEKAAEILSKPHVSNNSGNNEWYTPTEFCESARAVMGEITLDPASCKVANKQVKAKKFYTQEQDGLDREWDGRVWLNPPYGQPLIAEFAKKVVLEWQSGRIAEAIVLVNNATETAWFQLMLAEAAAVCFKAGRIRFLDSDGEPSKTPLQGQAFLYFGSNGKKFCKEFAQYGRCMS